MLTNLCETWWRECATTLSPENRAADAAEFIPLLPRLGLNEAVDLFTSNTAGRHTLRGLQLSRWHVIQLRVSPSTEVEFGVPKMTNYTLISLHPSQRSFVHYYHDRVFQNDAVEVGCKRLIQGMNVHVLQTILHALHTYPAHIVCFGCDMSPFR